MKKRMILLLTFLLFFCGMRSARAFDPPGADQKKLTLMVYMCGSNLESRFGSASADIQEMLDSGFDSDEINLLVMTGGSQKWAMGFGAGQTMIHEISRRGRRAVWPGRGEAEQVLNMGDRYTLSFFLEYCAEHYPAEQYALVLWDHGGGPMTGLCWDELFRMDHLSVRDVADALNRFQLATMGKKLGWIGFDACLMSSLEVACALAPYAEYMIASQETEPAHGWNYAFLQGLENDENGGQTGRRIVDAYFAQGADGGDTLTLACVDLKKVGTITGRMDPFFRRQAQQITEELFPRLSSLRMQSKGFGKADITSSGDYDLVDLKDLVTRLDAEGGAELLEAVRDAVVYVRSNTEGASGLSVYHPYRNKLQYMDSWHALYADMKGSQGYADYIFRFGSVLTSEETVDWGGLTTRFDGKDGNGFRLSCPLSPDQAANYVYGRLVIMTASRHNDGVKDTFNPIAFCPARLDESGVVHADYDGRGLYAVIAEGTEEKEKYIGPLGIYETNHPEISALSVNLTTKNAENTIQKGGVLFREDPDQPGHIMTRILLYDEAVGKLSERMLFREEDYDAMYFRFRNLTLPRNSDRGTLPGFSEWAEESGRMHWEGFEVGKTCVYRYLDVKSSDRLYAMFEITDARQNAFCSYPVEIPNPNLQEVAVLTPECAAEEFRARAMVRMNHTQGEEGLRIFVTIKNRTGTQCRVTLTDVVLNGTRMTETGRMFVLDPEDERYTYLDISVDEMLMLGQVRSVGMTAVLEPGLDWKNRQERQISFDLETVELDGFVPACQVLAEGENGEISCQLLDIFQQQNGDVRVVLHVSGKLDEESHYSIALNEIQTGGGFTLPPDYDQILRIDVPNTIRESSALIKIRGVNNFNRNIVSSENVLQRHGCRTIETVRIAKSSYNTQPVDMLVLDLPEPLVLSQALRSPGFLWYGPVSEADPKKASETMLLDWPDYSIGLERVFVGDNSAVFVMSFTNRTDLFLKIEMENIRIDNMQFYTYGSVFLLPHCTQYTSYLFDIARANPNVKSISEFSFAVTGSPQSMQPKTLVHFNIPVSLGAPEGTALESAQLTAEPPAPPVLPETLPFELGVRYRAVAFRSQKNDFRWETVSEEDSFSLCFYADWTIVWFERSGESTGYWTANEDGSIATGDHESMTIRQVRGRILLRSGNKEYTLEPMQQP